MSKEKDTLKSNKGFNEILKAVAAHNPRQKKEQNKSSPPKSDRDK